MVKQAELEDVLSFWCGTLDAEGLAPDKKAQAWWRKDEALDREISERFGPLNERLAAWSVDGLLEVVGEASGSWRDNPRGVLAAVIVLDQFSRNLYRNDPRAFAADALALTVVERALEVHLDEKLIGDERAFFYLPLMHDERLDRLERCLALFTAFRDASSGRRRERLDGNVAAAEQHLAIIARFGRYPHRNAVLGRESTDEEREFLTQPGSSF